MTKIDSVELSRYVLARVGKMSHLKLQKLVYYIQAWHLAILEEPIIEDDFEAWLHGPVSRKLWNKYKATSNVYDDIVLTEEVGKKVVADIERRLSKSQLELIGDVLDQFGDKTAYYLESLTHSEDPWLNARRGLGNADYCERVIPKDEIKAFFQRILGEGDGGA